MRRAALLAALALPLAGCVTYEVVDHDTYYRRSDGAIVYRGEVYYPETRVLDPYDAWFYGWRGPVVVLDRWHDPWYDPWFDPWFGSRVSVSRWSSGWYWSVGLGWWNPWPYGYGWHGGGWSRPPGGGHRPPPAAAIERPMPKPVVLGSGPTVNLPPRDGPRADGEAVWPRAGGRRQPEPWPGAASPRWQEARPMPRRPVEVPAEVGADRLRRMPEAPVRIERPMQREAPIQAGRPLYREPSVPVERPMPIERPVMAERPMPIERPVMAERPMPIERPVMAERPPAFERPLPAERPAPAWTPSPREERSPEAEERIE
ncbi:hypothetical protein [Silanimonas lenta]|uniref:hypothetical protein n=1 Tax=Silanimonas lenta TaxID=265429 RepID=UPI002FE3113A